LLEGAKAEPYRDPEPRLRLVTGLKKALEFSIAFVLIITAWSSPSQAQPTPCGVPESGTNDWQIGTPETEGIEPQSLCVDRQAE
jgi:hypothetical protein